MADIHQLDAEMRWEIEGVTRATRRYQEAVAALNPEELPHGSKLLRRLVNPLIPAIQAAQAEVMDLVAGGKGRPPIDAWPMQLISPEKAAVITATVGLRMAVMAECDTAHAFVTQGKTLCTVLREQLEFDRWEAEQIAAKRQAKRTGQEFDDLLAKLKARYPTVQQRTWRAWRVKVEAAREAPWPEEVQVALAARLFLLLVDNSGGLLRIETRFHKGHLKRTILEFTPEGAEVLSDLTVKAEVARPLLMPMITPPLPWRYE